MRSEGCTVATKIARTNLPFLRPPFTVMAGCQLENYREDEECPGRVTIDEDGTEEWAVERILSKRKEDGDWKYEIKWHGWPK